MLTIGTLCKTRRDNITFENVIRNQLIIDEGDAYNEILLNKSINNLKSIVYFKYIHKLKTKNYK